MENNIEQLESFVRNCVTTCISMLVDIDNNADRIVSILEALQEILIGTEGLTNISWFPFVISTLEIIIELLVVWINNGGSSIAPVGRPKIVIPVSDIEHLLSLKFEVTMIAKMYSVSRQTIHRRLREEGISVSESYTAIDDSELHQKLLDILTRFPNTGYKRMKGFLLQEGIKLTDQRIRAAMRLVDPEGVFQRTLSNRAIVRRQYYVEYFNELWHLDTNMKLIRWNIIIRSCIDGKSRVVTYLNASSDNTAESNLISFLKAVSAYGIPYRTRSDKGGENVLIAKYMIEQRGTGRGSHICGRSVHNQRIERYWRDVFYGYTSTVYNVLTALEEDGHLDIDNPKHISVLHKVFIPRINFAFQEFLNGWNYHPLSSERNFSPVQLMLLHRPPLDRDLGVAQMDFTNILFMCNEIDDLVLLQEGTEDTVANPYFDSDCLTSEETERVNVIDMTRHSTCLGYDIFIEAVGCLSL